MALEARRYGSRGRRRQPRPSAGSGILRRPRRCIRAHVRREHRRPATVERRPHDTRSVRAGIRCEGRPREPVMVGVPASLRFRNGPRGVVDVAAADHRMRRFAIANEMVVTWTAPSALWLLLVVPLVWLAVFMARNNFTPRQRWLQAARALCFSACWRSRSRAEKQRWRAAWSHRWRGRKLFPAP